ncbi:hypothetical protein EJB05_03014, partial [Eragrostis curvula]
MGPWCLRKEMMLRAKCSSSMEAAATGTFPFIQSSIASSAKRAPTFSTLANCIPATPTRDPFAITQALATASSPASTLPPYVGKKLHALSIKLGMAVDTFTMNHLLIFYYRHDLLDCALDVFDEMRHRNLVSWTSMVSACMRNGASELGLGLFASMLRSGFCPNEFPLASVLGACHSTAHIKLGLSLHGLAAKVGTLLITVATETFFFYKFYI